MPTLWRGIRVDRDITDRRTKAWRLKNYCFTMRIQALEDVMKSWSDLLNKMEIPFILNQSIVLGIHRNGKIFPNERVMEFAVIGDDLTPDKLKELKENKDYGYHYESSHIVPIGLLYFRDLELQPIYFKNGKALYNLLEDDCLVYDEDLLRKENWEQIEYKENTYNVPKDREKFLTQAYGDWKTPNPSYNWKNDAKNRMKWDII